MAGGFAAQHRPQTMALIPTVLRLPAIDPVLAWPDRARRLASAGRQPGLDAVPADLAERRAAARLGLPREPARQLDLRCPKYPSGCRVLRQTGSA